MEKMTNVKALNYVLANCEIPTDVREKLERMVETNSRKNNTSGRKATKTQIENEALITEVLAMMETGKAYTITELVKAFASEKVQTSQKMQALVKKMIADGKATRSEEKGKAYFTKC